MRGNTGVVCQGYSMSFAAKLEVRDVCRDSTPFYTKTWQSQSASSRSSRASAGSIVLVFRALLSLAYSSPEASKFARRPYSG